MPPIPVPRAVLADHAVVLRPTAERDIPEILIAYEDDRRLHERLGERRPPSGADLGRASEQAAEEWAQGTRAALTIALEHSDTCVGQVILDEIDWEAACARVRIWLAPAVRGRGHGAVALKLAGRWAARELGLARLEAIVPLENEALRRAAAAAGFAEEGAEASTVRIALEPPGER